MRSKVGETLPDEATLEARLESVLESGLNEFIKHTQDRRAQVRSNIRFTFISFAFFTAVCIFFGLLLLRVHEAIVLRVASVLSIVWLLVLLLSGRAWLRNSRLLAREINMALVPIFSSVFDRLFLYTHNGEKVGRVRTLLAKSSLLTTEGLSIKADDSFEVFTADEGATEFHEVFASIRRATGVSGRDQVETEVFRGMLMVTNLKTAHDAETYISTDGDRYGFAHQSFWSGILGGTDVKATELEWNDFEQALHVASTNERVAREFLTPEVMQDIYDWWREHELNMRIAVTGNRLYLLLPESKTRIESSTTSVKLSTITKYAKTLARPIWRGLLLADDVAGR